MRNYSLKKHNTFGLDVTADTYYEYSSEEELMHLIDDVGISSRHVHIGSGSNLLFINPRYHGTVLHSNIKGIEIVYDYPEFDIVHVRVGAGVLWDDFVEYCVENGLYGVENLSLIPGEVGAAAVQNIGAYGTEVGDLIFMVNTVNMDGSKVSYTRAGCEYGYRNSIFKRPGMKNTFITHVTFNLRRHGEFNLKYKALSEALAGGEDVTLRDVRDAIIKIRRSKLPDPAVIGSAGSFFKNPVVSAEKAVAIASDYPSMPFYPQSDDKVKLSAGWLIEQCGWKGKSLGPAAVYPKQALVIVNNGGATGDDILQLAIAIQDDVVKRFDILLEPEVKIID